MEQSFFTYLPPEMSINILSRLPVRTTMRCKCVCKQWLDLLKTPEFVKSHFSKSVPGLAVFQGQTSSKPYKVIEFVDELDPEYSKRNCNTVFNFSFPHHKLILSSAKDLLFLFNCTIKPYNNLLIICNPVTREYIKLPAPQVRRYKWIYQYDIFGFGVSKMTDQYKVVRIFDEAHIPETDLWRLIGLLKCQVYTLGRGSWKTIAPTRRLKYVCYTSGVFLNGNSHWLVCDLEDSPLISYFDFETEVFTSFSPPHLHGYDTLRCLSALGDCLCLCDNTDCNEIVIWLMKDCGDEKSWTKEFIISKRPCRPHVSVSGILQPVKVFNKSKTIEETDLIERYGDGFTSSGTVSYTPSFLSLKTFTMENVSSF